MSQGKSSQHPERTPSHAQVPFVSDTSTGGAVQLRRFKSADAKDSWGCDEETERENKVSVLMQSIALRLPVSSPSLIAESYYILQNAPRLFRAMTDIAFMSSMPVTAEKALNWAQAIELRLPPRSHPLLCFSEGQSIGAGVVDRSSRQWKGERYSDVGISALAFELLEQSAVQPMALIQNLKSIDVRQCPSGPKLDSLRQPEPGARFNVEIQGARSGNGLDVRKMGEREMAGSEASQVVNAAIGECVDPGARKAGGGWDRGESGGRGAIEEKELEMARGRLSLLALQPCDAEVGGSGGAPGLSTGRRGSCQQRGAGGFAANQLECEAAMELQQLAARFPLPEIRVTSRKMSPRLVLVSRKLSSRLVLVGSGRGVVV